jgi:hypothetical protein
VKYDGKTDIRNYLVQFDLTANYNGWNDEECGLQLATSLIGEAREVLSFLPLEMASDYESLYEALMKRYAPHGRETHFTVQLWNRCCEKGESVATFGHAIRKLAREAYPGLSIHEQLLVDLFIKGLPTLNMRRHVHMARPRTLDAAIVLATTYEAFDTQAESGDKQKKPKGEPTNQVVRKGGADRRKAVRSAVQGQRSEGQPGTTPPRESRPTEKVENKTDTDSSMLDYLKALQERLERLEKKLRPRPRAEVECFGCKQKGHYKNECPNAKSGSDQPPLN